MEGLAKKKCVVTKNAFFVIRVAGDQNFNSQGGSLGQ